MRWLAPLPVAVTLAGCVSFVPTYNEDIYKHLDAVSTDMAKLKAMTTVQPGPLSLEKAEPIYTDALANLDLAKAAAQNRVTQLRGRIAVTPANDIADTIDRCREAVEGMIKLNRTQPLSAKGIDDAAVADVCSVSRTMEKRLDGSAKK